MLLRGWENTGSDPGCLLGSRSPALPWMHPPPQALVLGWYLQKEDKNRKKKTKAVSPKSCSKPTGVYATPLPHPAQHSEVPLGDPQTCSTPGPGPAR